MLKLISNSSEMGNISVYISVKNALLLNELTEILKKRNILVYTKREKIRKTNYLITDDVNIKKSIFTDNTASIYITDIKSDLSKKKITKKLKYFNAVLQFEDLLLKEQNIEILANKIVNVLLSLKRKSFVRHILMSPGN
ncbi:MAG TPA: hypothetical protein VI819_03720, partial [Patescibacteria group bacterium]|nr:hypothetical protein [Patescibacteria group bacterium]